MRRLGYLTSHLYPVLVEDRAALSASIVGGQLKDTATAFSDTVGLSYGVVSAELRTLLKATTMPTDTVGLSYGVVSASLATVLKRYEQWPKETAALSASIVSGSLI